MVPLPVLAAALATGDATIHWHAPSECPTAEDVAARARALGVNRGEATVDIAATSGGYTASITLGDDARTLQSASCDELATAVAVLLAATMVDPAPPPEDEVPPDPPPVDELPPDDPPPQREPITRPLPPPRRERPSPRAYAVRGPTIAATSMLAAGLVPKVGGGGGLAFGWAWRRATIEIGGWVIAPRDVTPRADTKGRVMIGAATVSGCGRFARAWFEARTCGGFEAGATRITTTGTTVKSGRRDPWLAFRGAARLFAWVHPRIAPMLSAGAVVPVLHSDYVVDEGALFLPSPVAFAATLGIEVALMRDRSASTRRP